MHRFKHVLALAVAALALTTGVLASTAGAATKAGTIPETAAAAGNFKTLVSLLQATGLDAVLAKGGPYTVFAPTDEAFAKVPKATLDALAANKALLASVLLYHVVGGSVPASEAVKLTSAQTLNGSSMGISVVGGSVYINNAKVTTPDVMASNGVIHVIDTVLIPPVTPSGSRVLGIGSGAGYCAVAGNTTPSGAPIPAGRFLDLDYGQPSWDFHYAGATVANYVQGVGLTCSPPPAGYTLNGTAPSSLGVPSGLYPYYTK
jgi:uncharacterized surface protein with fasciclin (FAS1) repeats